MQRILTVEHEKLISEERSLLEDLRVQLTKLDADEDDLSLLKSSIAQLEDLFLLVVVGEFNSGKTSFLNALLGDKLLTEGVTPTTDQIHIIRHGETVKKKPIGKEMLVLEMPVDWLNEINLVDTPGTNAIFQKHQEITEEFVPRSDLVLFVTSADRPFSESERQFLEQIREWGKKIVVVVNKIDLVQTEADRQTILSFIEENATELLGTTPDIFPVSARAALEAKMAGKEAAAEQWTKSNFGALESYMLETLDASERIRLKLDNPLGVAEHMIAKYEDIVANNQAILADDFETLTTIEEQLEAYQDDMRRDFKYHSSHVENVLYEMVERSDKFMENKLQITNISALMNGEKLRAEFEREVVADTSVKVERHVSELIDWLVERDQRQWRDLLGYLDRQTSKHADRMVGSVKRGEFELTRKKLLDSIGRDAKKVVESYDKEAESLQLSKNVQSALVQTAAVQAGALGLGTVLVMTLQGAMLDFTGVLGASAVAALGFAVLPYRRSKIKKEIRAKVEELRGQINGALEKQFKSDLSNSVQHVNEALGPYTRFVRTEKDKFEGLESGLEKTSVQVHEMREKVGTIE